MFIGRKPTDAPLTSSDITDGIISTAKIADDAVTAAKAAFAPGKVLQIVQTTDNSAISLAKGAEYTDIRTAITPSSSSNKILILVTLGLVSSDGAADCGWTIKRDSTSLQLGTGGTDNSTYGAFLNQGASDAFNAAGTLLDSPSTTSEISYKVYAEPNTSRTFVINKRNSDNAQRVSSSMILMEVAG